MDIETKIGQLPYRPVGGYRLILALLVLTSHSSDFLPHSIGRLALGNVGVFCFFVLSGYVIAEALDVFYRGAPGRFLTNRFLKLYPAYAVATVLALVLVKAVPLPQYGTDAWTVAVNFSMVLAYLPAGNTALWISVVWAVIVEIQFYVAAALVFYAAHRSARPRLVLGAAAVIAVTASLWVDATGGAHRFYGALRHAPYFIAGVALYFAHTRRNPAAWVLAVIAFPLSLHAYWVYSAPSGDARTASLALFAVTGASLAWVSRLTLPRSWEYWDKRAGAYTYSIYLVHFPIINAVAAQGWSPAVSLAVILAASAVASLAILSLVEEPLARLRDRVRGLRLYG